jgi:hypothetical protein
MALSIGTCVFYRLEELPDGHHPKSDLCGKRGQQLVFPGAKPFAWQKVLSLDL